MPACTFTSDRPSRFHAAAILALLAIFALGARSSPAWADSNNSGQSGVGSTPDRTTTPEEEDYTQTPYTDYGEFNSDKEEQESNRFFEYGRFFGVSLGLGFETADGDRGTLYQGGFPTFDFKLHYWFDFHFAMDMNFTYAEQYFITASPQFSPGSTPPTTPIDVRYNVNLMRLGIDLKYYFDVKNLTAAISFANPYILIGAGDYTKTESSATGTTSQTDTENAVGFNAGVGFEFAVEPHAVYLSAEARVHLVQFADYNTQDFQLSEGLPDMHGNFYTFIGSVMFTW